MPEEIIRIENLKKYYAVRKTAGKKAGLLHAVDNVSLSVQKGKIFGIVGESGCVPQNQEMSQ